MAVLLFLLLLTFNPLNEAAETNPLPHSLLTTSTIAIRPGIDPSIPPAPVIPSISVFGFRASHLCLGIPDIFIALFLIVLILMTVLGNVLVVLSVFLYKRMRTFTNFLLTSLATADLLVGLLIMPLSLIDLLHSHHWPFGKTLCQLWATTDVLLCTASILNLCIISLDRYMAITSPLKYPRTRSRPMACTLLCLAWGISVVVCSPPWFIREWGLFYRQNLRSDQPIFCAYSPSRPYRIYSALCSFYIPLLVMLSVYFKIFRVASDRERLMRQNMSGTCRLSKRVEKDQQRDRDTERKHPPSAANNYHSRCASAPTSRMGASVGSAVAATATATAGQYPQEYSSMLDHKGTSLPPRRNSRLPPARQAQVPCRAETVEDCSPDESDSRTVQEATEEDVAHSQQSSLRGDRRKQQPPLSRKRLERESKSLVNLSDCSMLDAADEGQSRRKNTDATGDVLDAQPLFPRAHPNPNLHSRPHRDSGPRLSSVSNYPHQFNNGHPHHHRMQPTNLVAKAQQHYQINGPGKNLRGSKEKIVYMRERKALKTIGIVVFAFVICWLPFFVVYLLEVFISEMSDSQSFKVLNEFFLWLGYSNSVLNPIIYTAYNGDFRRCFRDLLGFGCLKKHRRTLSVKKLHQKSTNAF